MIRKRLSVILSLGVLFAFTASFPLKAQAISAESAAVIDVDSGRILFAKNAEMPSRIASLTKIMTAIVAIERGNLNDTVTVSRNAYGVEGSSIYLRRGEKLKLIDLLYGIMLRSGNDAAVAVAEHVGGSVEEFVEMMNEKAKELGMKDTKFINPHGLDEKKGSNISTARDMAILTAYALKNPVFAEIVSTKFRAIPYEGQPGGRKLQNKNKMLYRYQGADGVKTGYTVLAQRCLASSATRDGWQLASIVLRAPNWYEDSMRILDNAFQAYKRETLVKGGETAAYLPVVNGKRAQVEIVTKEGYFYPLKKEEKEQIRIETTLPAKIRAPVEKGEKIGELKIYFHEEPLKTIDLVANGSVEKRSWWERLKEWF
ncbi:D-alanyl-D-alanine carboxypeptidase family protein [Bacillaceae bacterium]